MVASRMHGILLLFFFCYNIYIKISDGVAHLAISSKDIPGY